MERVLEVYFHLKKKDLQRYDYCLVQDFHVCENSKCIFVITDYILKEIIETYLYTLEDEVVPDPTILLFDGGALRLGFPLSVLPTLELLLTFPPRVEGEEYLGGTIPLEALLEGVLGLGLGSLLPVLELPQACLGAEPGLTPLLPAEDEDGLVAVLAAGFVGFEARISCLALRAPPLLLLAALLGFVSKADKGSLLLLLLRALLLLGLVLLDGLVGALRGL